MAEPKDPKAMCFIEPTEELRKKLTSEEYSVLVESATEPPFQNRFWNNHEAGIYVDAIDGTPLFASYAKFDSGSGWPSFGRSSRRRAEPAKEYLSVGTSLAYCISHQ
jgi:peptide-methionine (R)-S-oxide reductase